MKNIRNWKVTCDARLGFYKNGRAGRVVRTYFASLEGHQTILAKTLKDLRRYVDEYEAETMAKAIADHCQTNGLTLVTDECEIEFNKRGVK